MALNVKVFNDNEIGKTIVGAKISKDQILVMYDDMHKVEIRAFDKKRYTALEVMDQSWIHEWATKVTKMQHAGIDAMFENITAKDTAH